MFDLPIPHPNDATEWVATLPKPTWDAYFMAQVFMAAMKSNDQQTKQGAIVVDDATKIPLGSGFNGHPRGSVGLPTMRENSALITLRHADDHRIYRLGEMIPPGTPLEVKTGNTQEWIDVSDDSRHFYVQQQPDKYKFMCHCETNALLHMTQHSPSATLYIPMPSCDMCAGYVLNHPYVKVKRIVYYEDRPLQQHLFASRPDVSVEKYDVTKNGEPYDLLIRAAQYCKLRATQGQQLSKGVTLSYLPKGQG